MPIPDRITVLNHLLKYLGDAREHNSEEVINYLAKQYGLSKNEKCKLENGKQPIFYKRVGWAKTTLKKQSLLESTKRGWFKITKSGLVQLVVKNKMENKEIKQVYGEGIALKNNIKESTHQASDPFFYDSDKAHFLDD